MEIELSWQRAVVLVLLAGLAGSFYLYTGSSSTADDPSTGETIDTVGEGCDTSVGECIDSSMVGSEGYDDGRVEHMDCGAGQVCYVEYGSWCDEYYSGRCVATEQSAAVNESLTLSDCPDGQVCYMPYR